MKWYAPIDPDDLQNGQTRMDEAQVESQLDALFSNNESYQGLFPVYGDLVPYGQTRSHSRDRRRTWHGGCDLMYAVNTPVYPIGEGLVLLAKDSNSNGNAANRVIIEHDVDGKKVYSLYTHLNQNSIPSDVKSLVNSGSLIQPSQMIGKIGDSGSANPHLHFEVFSTHKLSVSGFIGDTNSVVFEQNPTRFRVSYKKDNSVGVKPWSGTVYPSEGEVFIGQDYPNWSSLFLSTKTAFRKWVVKHKSVWSGIDSITELSSDRICWHYHPIQFIRAMNSLENSAGNFPVDVGKGREVSDDSLDYFYYHIEKANSGGYFPVGANTVWHGGVHLYVAKGKPVHACLPGRLVAARLAESTDQAEGEYGCRNFILMQHERNGCLFYSLYMHLAALKLDPDDSFIKRVTWLNDELIDKFKSGDIVKLDVKLRADQLLWQSGEYGSEDHRKGMIHWEIFSEENVFPPATNNDGDSADEEEGDAGVANTTDGADIPALRVKGVEGPKKAYPSTKVSYRATKFNSENPPASEKKHINWLVELDGQEVMKKEKQGAVLSFEVPYEWRGKKIVVKPYINKPDSDLFVQSRVAQRKPLLWKAIEDTDSDFNMDSEVVFNLFADDQDDGFWASDEILTTEELQRFYSTNIKAERLRAYGCRFVSEWGIKDLDGAIDKLKGRWLTFGLKDRIAPYQWWSEAIDAGCSLPKSPMCWHYNPVSVLESFYVGEGMRNRRKDYPATEGVAIRFGVFFDGTGNNMVNHRDEGFDSNVARLFELYNAAEPNNKGQLNLHSTGVYEGRELLTGKLYKNGVGTSDGGEDSSYGQGTGAGGLKRIEEAIEALEVFFDKVSGLDGPRIIDVFGFSRGASLARDFVNQVNRKFSEKGVSVGFVGLYDTVASFGVGGNNSNYRTNHPLTNEVGDYLAWFLGPGAKITTELVNDLIFDQFELDLSEKSADYIVQLVAEDEVRANFPLHSLKTSKSAALPSNMEEHVVVGVHSNVGGGYGVKPVEALDRIEERTIRYQTLGPSRQVHENVMRQKRALENEAASRGLELIYVGTDAPVGGSATDTYWLAKRRIAKPGLSNVYLHWMYEKASTKGVPLTDIAVLEQQWPLRFTIAQELNALFQPDHITAVDADKIRGEYVHMSHRDWEDADEDHRWIVNRATFSGERVIYYNKPHKAVLPEKTASASTEQTDEMEEVAP